MAGNGSGGRGGRKRTAEAREAAAANLAAGATVPDAARRAGVGERTLFRWRPDPAFMERVRSLRSDATCQTLGTLTAGSKQAAEQLIELLGESNAAVRLGAASCLLKTLLSYRDQTDLSDRIDRIEKRLDDESRPRRFIG
jgi:hypothetical protein